MEFKDLNYFAGGNFPLYEHMAWNSFQNEPQMSHEIVLNARPLSATPLMDEEFPQQPIVKRVDRDSAAKRYWTPEEDRMLFRLVEECGSGKWSYIAGKLNTRMANQCRDRWHNYLRPNIKKDAWNDDEDRILIEAHTEFGSKWAKIARRLPDRTENSIKNRWNSTKRRVLAGRILKGKRTTLLENYILAIHSTPAHLNAIPQYNSAFALPTQPIAPHSERLEAIEPLEFVLENSLGDEGELVLQEMASPSLPSMFQLEKLEKIERELMEILTRVD